MAAAAFLALAPWAWANWFTKGQPVPDWGVEAAKTRTPDYAKDAIAVVLFDEVVESVDAQGRATERHRRAVRILKPQGRDDLGCSVEFDVDDKVNYFRVWTIAADENRYQAQDTDFADFGRSEDRVMLTTSRVRVVRPPATDPGAVVICESEELMAPYDQQKDWFVQDDIPQVLQALEVDLPAGKTHVESWHRHDAVKPVEVTPGHWRWEIKDTPAFSLRDIPSRPDWWALAGRMTVHWGDAAVEGTDNQWHALGIRWTDLEAHRPDPSPEIAAKVNELIAGAPDFYTKLSRITEYIQKNVRYFIVMRGIGGWQANPAADIFRNRYGDCKDKTTLLISMLHVAGIEGAYLLVDHRRGVVDPKSPSFYGDHMITAIEIPDSVNDARLQAVVKGNDGKRYLIFDPTDERTPVGNLPSNEQGSYGLLAHGGSSQVLALPILAPEANGTVEKGQFTLAQDGTLTGTLDTSHMGPEGAELRSFLKYTDEKERREVLETLLARDVPGITMNSYQFVQTPELDKPMEFHIKITAALYAHTAGPLLLVRPRVVGIFGTATQPFDNKPRTLPIYLEATGHWHDSYDISIPDGYVVDETPDPVDVDMDFASYHSTISAKGNQIHYERDFIVKQVELPADKAQSFRKLEGAILMDEKGTAVLKKK
jgi:hypothetical protein